MTNPMTTKEIAALAEALEGCEERIDADGSVRLNLLQVDAENAAETIRALAARVERLDLALSLAMPFIVTDVLEHCDGNKCRELWCAGCMGQETAEANVERANEAYKLGHDALNAKDVTL